MLPEALLPIVQRAACAAVLVDFDGTLSPIVDHPEAAVPLPAARAALGALVGRCALVGVVSGRPVQFLHDAIALDGVEYVGQYGLERLAAGAVIADPGVEPYRAAIARAADAADAAFPDLYVERKGSIAVTLHWRTASERARSGRGVGRRDRCARGARGVPDPDGRGAAAAGGHGQGDGRRGAVCRSNAGDPRRTVRRRRPR